LGESSSSATPTESEGEAQQRQLKTAAELAEMIEFDLARHPDCPKAGFRVTVYGWPYWRTMLTITPAAGRVRNLKNGETLPVSSLSGFASGTIWLGTSEATTRLLFCDKNPALTFS
jgi:hypothetical protein